MKFTIHSLQEYPNQPIKDFAEARNWFLKDLPDDEYVLFTSDHEDTPMMLLEYIGKLAPIHPYYYIRLIRLVNYKLEPLRDPTYQPNLCSNRMRFVGGHADIPTPRFAGGYIDVPMIHNFDPGRGHSYRISPPSRIKILFFVLKRSVLIIRSIIRDEYGRGLLRRGSNPKEYSYCVDRN